MADEALPPNFADDEEAEEGAAPAEVGADDDGFTDSSIQAGDESTWITVVHRQRWWVVAGWQDTPAEASFGSDPPAYCSPGTEDKVCCSARRSRCSRCSRCY